MIEPALAAQLDGLRRGATPRSVPSGVLAWWGRTDFPSGAAGAPAMTQEEWTAAYSRLEQAALAPGIVPSLLEQILPLTLGFRPDGPLPVAIASYPLSSVRPAFASQVLAAARARQALPNPVPPLDAIIEPAQAFFVSGLLHDQWGMAAPVFRSRVVTYLLDQRFYLSTPGEPLPDLIELDPGDGRGFRPLAFGDQLVAVYPTGNQAVATVRCTYGATVLQASFVTRIGGPPAAPPPDETWSLWAGNTGTAWVYRAPGRAAVEHPVIVAEGFPGGYAYDYLYDMMDQAGTLESLRSSGYDVVLLGFGNGTDLIERNAQVAIACLHRAMQATGKPLVVGGVSMGGLITRYALAWLESRGLPHQTRLFFTVDTPHRGAYTSLADQWFAHTFASAQPMAAAFAALLDSPANQQFVMSWLDGDTPMESPLRSMLLADFEAVGGYPKRPRRIAISCGRGDGQRSVQPGAQMLTWDGGPFAGAQLWALPQGATPAVIAKGYNFLADPARESVLTTAAGESWEGAPGGQDDYTMDAAFIAQAMGCGTVANPVTLACGVPTVSALDLDGSPFVPVPPPSAKKSPFDDYTWAEQNEPHLTITPAASAWLLQRIGAPPPASHTG
jgi:hypothetical protein